MIPQIDYGWNTIALFGTNIFLQGCAPTGAQASASRSRRLVVARLRRQDDLVARLADELAHPTLALAADVRIGRID